MAISVLIGFQLLIAFGSVGLLERMVPAAKQIITENVYSLEAVETMLALIGGPEANNPKSLVEFNEALKRAKNNVTEEAEKPLISIVETKAPQLLQGDMKVREDVVRSLVDLARINREAIYVKAKRAERLGLGGSWAVVLLSLIGIAASILVYYALLRRVVTPLTELCVTLRDWRDGNFLRRCEPVDATPEIKNAMTIVNQLFDERLSAK